MGGELGLAGVVGRQRRRVLGDAVTHLEGEVRRRRADELREDVLGRDVVDVL
jgi:hypothetical protein